MRRVVWWAGLILLVAVPAWGWDRYGSYPGDGNTLQLRNDLNSLERQVRDLQREVDRLQNRLSHGTSGSSRYPLPGQGQEGFRAVRDGAYELDLNGTVLRIERNGDVNLRSAGVVRLEGTTVTTHSRESSAQ